ncbi:hypothetical protein B0H17DRAFT_1280400 [Mycena rosella]|uniref:Uncharacterized protein n=1 Tax=Mycena rosella TaxID=1033263 RepID=A0AAD7GFZ9_MYCRO|nr:hypothetical protein B0H17DRAFT_1280400 [Mycena rosella]
MLGVLVLVLLAACNGTPCSMRALFLLRLVGLPGSLRLHVAADDTSGAETRIRPAAPVSSTTLACPADPDVHGRHGSHFRSTAPAPAPLTRHVHRSSAPTPPSRGTWEKDKTPLFCTPVPRAAGYTTRSASGERLHERRVRDVRLHRAVPRLRDTRAPSGSEASAHASPSSNTRAAPGVEGAVEQKGRTGGCLESGKSGMNNKQEQTHHEICRHVEEQEVALLGAQDALVDEALDEALADLRTMRTEWNGEDERDYGWNWENKGRQANARSDATGENTQTGASRGSNATRAAGEGGGGASERGEGGGGGGGGGRRSVVVVVLGSGGCGGGAAAEPGGGHKSKSTWRCRGGVRKKYSLSVTHAPPGVDPQPRSNSTSMRDSARATVLILPIHVGVTFPRRNTRSAKLNPNPGKEGAINAAAREKSKIKPVALCTARARTPALHLNWDSGQATYPQNSVGRSAKRFILRAAFSASNYRNLLQPSIIFLAPKASCSQRKVLPERRDHALLTAGKPILRIKTLHLSVEIKKPQYSQTCTAGSRSPYLVEFNVNWRIAYGYGAYFPCLRSAGSTAALLTPPSHRKPKYQPARELYNHKNSADAGCVSYGRRGGKKQETILVASPGVEP